MTGLCACACWAPLCLWYYTVSRWCERRFLGLLFIVGFAVGGAAKKSLVVVALGGGTVWWRVGLRLSHICKTSREFEEQIKSSTWSWASVKNKSTVLHRELLFWNRVDSVTCLRSTCLPDCTNLEVSDTYQPRSLESLEHQKLSSRSCLERLHHLMPVPNVGPSCLPRCFLDFSLIF